MTATNRTHAEIAASLTPAQRRAVLRAFVRAGRGLVLTGSPPWSRADGRVLERLGLIKRVEDPLFGGESWRVDGLYQVVDAWKAMQRGLVSSPQGE
jgi:hypothetical protein